jgi:hypothetical protein
MSVKPAPGISIVSVAVNSACSVARLIGDRELTA